MVCLMLGTYSFSAMASEGHHRPGAKKKQSPVMENVSPASTPCKIHISPREDREIIIMKLQERMDCLEVKLNEVQSEVTLLRNR